MKLHQNSLVILKFVEDSLLKKLKGYGLLKQIFSKLYFSNYFFKFFPFFFFQIFSSFLPQILLDPFLNIFVSNIFERLPRFMFLHVSTVIVLVCAFIANSEHILRTKYSALISYFTCNFAQVLSRFRFWS